MKSETAVSAALDRAGFNTDEARLRQVVHAAVTKHHGNVERAVKTATDEALGDHGLTRELLRFYIERFEGLLAKGHATNVFQSSFANGRQTHPAEVGHAEGVNPSPSARPGREPSAAQTAADAAVRTRAALGVFDRELTRTGQRWGNVYYCELSNMTEDGEVARAIRLHIGSLRGEQALKPIRDLMTPREFAILLNKARKGSK